MARPVGTKNIESPEKMWELFCQFRTEKKSTPIKKTIKGNKGFIISDENMERPLTLDGFSAWLFENNITGNVHDYFGNSKGLYSDYSDICRVIKEIIRTDQIEGGMAGIYNPSITQRLNGLVDKTQVETIREQPLFGEDKKE